MSIADALSKAGIEAWHAQLGTQRLRCPRCDRHKPDDALALTIEDGAAVWYCHRCGFRGCTRGGETSPGAARNVVTLDRAGAEARAARKANAIWSSAKLAGDHPYLSRKGILGFGLRRVARLSYSTANAMENALLVPMRDESREIVNLQGIGPDGTKRFLASGKTRGCFALVRHIDVPWRELGERIAIGEGYASVFSFCRLHPGFRGVAALSAGNLPTVARLFRKQFPRVEIAIAADQDIPGARAAGEASVAVGALVYCPGFGRVGIVDWNDFETHERA